MGQHGSVYNKQRIDKGIEILAQKVGQKKFPQMAYAFQRDIKGGLKFSKLTNNGKNIS